MKRDADRLTKDTIESITEDILRVLSPILEMELRRAIESRVMPVLKSAESMGDNPKLAYSVKEASALLGISESTLQRLIYAGHIKTVKLPEGQRRLIARDTLIAWLNEYATKDVPEYLR